jgi:hypothetical protein
MTRTGDMISRLIDRVDAAFSAEPINSSCHNLWRINRELNYILSSVPERYGIDSEWMSPIHELIDIMDIFLVETERSEN